MLRDRFKDFARDTETIGNERVAAVNEIADQLISAGHSDAATIALWKDGLNESWADLLELIDTRTQMLAASWELHKFFHDCKDVLSRILEKQNSISDELGRDAGSVSALQRKHQNFVQDLVMLQQQASSQSLLKMHMMRFCLYKWHSRSQLLSSMIIILYFLCRFNKFRMTLPSYKLHMRATKPGKLQTVRQKLCLPGWTCRECVKIAELSSATQETCSSSSTWCAHSYCGWMMLSDRWTLLRNQGINKYICIAIVYFTK